MRTVGQSVEGLVQLAGVTPGADGDHREKTGLVGRLGARDCVQETAHLTQGVVEDVGKPVAVTD